MPRMVRKDIFRISVFWPSDLIRSIKLKINCPKWS